MSIIVENLSYTYLPGTPFEHTALKDVNFEIADGEFVGIIGHTGSGKSTLVQIVSGLVKEYEGRVLINGTDYSEKKADKMSLRRTVGIVFQYPEYQLFEESVEKDISYGPMKLGVPEKEWDGRVEVAMGLVGLDYQLYRHKSPFALSGGEKRKVAIAGVLAMEPSILIMDEPIAGLDPMGRESFMELTRTLNETGITILMISHNMDNLAEYADRLLVMKDGALFLNDTPTAIYTDAQKIREAGMGMPEAVIFAESLRAKGVPVPQEIIKYEQLKAFLTEYFGGGGV